jgi:hypothetical protein
MTNVEAVDLASTVLGLRHIGRSTDDEALAISRRSVGVWLWVRWHVEGFLVWRRNGASQSFPDSTTGEGRK